jgi:hypothetical protein
MNFYGLIPLGIGVYFGLYALGKVGSKNPEYQHQRESLMRLMLWLSPIALLYGVAVLFRFI